MKHHLFSLPNYFLSASELVTFSWLSFDDLPQIECCSEAWLQVQPC